LNLQELDMRTPIDHIKAKRARGEPALGVIVQTGCADNVEMAGRRASTFWFSTRSTVARRREQAEQSKVVVGAAKYRHAR
jgi:hypothetical protein